MSHLVCRVATVDDFDQRAHEHLKALTGRPGAVWHPGQLEAIRALARDRKRVLVVQRTGWGKSAVYFIATRLLRDAGAGPTILVSPLLALGTDQDPPFSRPVSRVVRAEPRPAV